MLREGTVEEFRLEQEAFTLVWKLMKKYYHIGESDEDWKNLIAEADAIGRRFEGSAAEHFAHSLLLATVEHLSEISETKKPAQKSKRIRKQLLSPHEDRG